MRRSEVLRKVLARVPKHIYEQICTYIRSHQPSLWAAEKPRSFLKDQILLTLYKDLYGVGYHQLAADASFGYTITDHSLNNNCKKIREVLHQWSGEVITIGNEQEWNNQAKNCSFGRRVSDVNLWIDSSDFPMIGKSSVSRKSSYWSYKLNGPGRRYQMISDAKGKIRKIWGGFSPKLYDGDFMVINKDYINEAFRGAKMIADNHYSKAKKYFSNVKIYTNFVVRQTGSKRKRGEEGEDDYVINTNKEQKEFNHEHQAARARVESPFGLIKRKFRCFQIPWGESEDQLNFAVYYAAAIVSLSTSK